MQKLAGLTVPAIVLVLLYIFPEHRTQFALPVGALCLSALVFAILEPKFRRPDLLAFWFSMLAVAWMLSERREAREVSPFAVPTFLAIFGLATAVLVSGKRLEKSHIPLLVGFFLTACVTFLSGSSGGSDKMESPLNFLGLSREQLLELIHWLRRVIHVTFYASLTLCFGGWLCREGLQGKKLLALAPLLPLACAICDEFRQSLMPNRRGSYQDVLLDTFAIVLGVLILRKMCKTAETSATTESLQS
jgi:VanZ family protein